ncbi:MAG: polysaccharide biosynthesis/export family protein [Acidobacteriota bacterium]|nr:polysaccharide biosynthesis/export family protein [Acidobacteriota bacterium]
MSKIRAARKSDAARRFQLKAVALLLPLALCCSIAAEAQRQQPDAQASTLSAQPPSNSGKTVRDYNRQLRQLLPSTGSDKAAAGINYRIGPEDLLQISVFEAPALNRTVRVSADGDISLPLLGAVQAAGLTSRQLEAVLEELLRRSYMKDPHVSVFVQEIKSHPVSVFGAVERPGVYQIRGAKTLVEVLSMAQGLASDAGDTVILERGSGQEAPRNFAGAADSRAATGPQSIRIPLESLLDSGNPGDNVLVYPGDIVKVSRAGIVYVVGEVKKPGGFTLKTNENISVLQALALAEGLTRTSAAKHALIIRTLKTSGKREEIPIDIDKILKGRAPDPLLRSRDVVFVPDSTGRAAFYRGAEAALSIAGGVIVYRR